MTRAWMAAVMLWTGCLMDPHVELEPIDPSGMHHTYIVNSLALPHSSTEVQTYALNLDESDDATRHNRIGYIIYLLLSIGDYSDRVDLEIEQRIGAGELIHLFDVQATALDDATRVGWSASLGQDIDGDPADNWPGPELYLVDRTAEPAAGRIIGGDLTAQRGGFPLVLVLPNVPEPIVLDLRGASIDATISATSLAGSVGGAIVEADIDRVLLPALQLGVQQMVIDSCGDSGPCPDGSLGRVVLDLFDEDDDRIVSQQELRNNSLIGSLFAPDVDLFDEHGDFNPRQDGINDSLSIGVGFTAVPAIFAPPEK